LNGADDTMKSKYNANVQEIDELNAADNGGTFAVNQFSGLNFDEFSAEYLTAEESVESDMPVLETMAETEVTMSAVDWSVTPVKDQGSCGSCWAFGTLGNVEHLHKLKTGKTVSLSEQQLVDCSTANNGCSGGRPDRAVDYLSGKSIYTTSSYPYRGTDGSCRSGTASGVTVNGYSRVGKSDSALASALEGSAITVMVYADSSFQHYSSGILTNPPTTCSLNHAVLATGYGSNFFKIKNSWGSSWGEGGFIRFARTTSGCGPYGIVYDYPTTATGTTFSEADVQAEESRLSSIDEGSKSELAAQSKVSGGKRCYSDSECSSGHCMRGFCKSGVLV